MLGGLTMQFLKDYPRKKITLQEIEQHYLLKDYRELYDFILSLIEQEVIPPIKSSGRNGKKPSLYKSYRLKISLENEKTLQDEVTYVFHPLLNQEYYLNHLKQYQLDRESILKINDFFKNKRELLQKSTSINERSFQIFTQEKFLATEGKRLLKNLGLSLEDLNLYETAEPLAYFSLSKKTPQTILIIENKDTFYSLRKHLMSGKTTIFGEEVQTLIYGGGKKVWKGFCHFEESVEPFLLHELNRFYYFGDLDYEGILIFEQLCAEFYCEPLVSAYEAMVKRGASLSLPKTKEGQNRNEKGVFFSYFEETSQMRAILEAGLYIPQEIVTMSDF